MMIEKMQNEHPPRDRRRMSPLKVASYAGLVAGVLVFICGLALLLFADPLVNRFIKPRIMTAFVEAYPAYTIGIAAMHYSVLKNSFGFDSVVLTAADGTFTSTMGTFSVSGIGWTHLLWGGSLAPHDFDNAVVDAHDIALTFPQTQYELRCGTLRLSVADSEMVAEALELHPAIDDERLFAGSKFRTTRFNLTTGQCRLTGVAFLETLNRRNYHARSIHIHDIGLDILINKDKPAVRDSSTVLMPNEILASMKDTLRCDTMDIVNGALKYGERFSLDSKPGVITFDSVEVLAEGLANYAHRDTALVIHAQGRFMKAGTMNMLMSFPVPLAAFSFQFSGSLSRMELSALNSFVEAAEQKRIKSGVVDAATFEINVALGRATGNVRAVYRDLTLAAINKHTGSEKGFVDGIASYIANTYKIRRTNVLDKSGSIQIGKVKYLRQRDDPFFLFVWSALRSGVADVVGF
jgi:hypothetical protein